MLGFAESKHPRLIVVKLLSKYSNLCDHSTSTLQTDRRTGGQTDDLPWQYRALRIIARWKLGRKQRQLKCCIFGSILCLRKV